MSTDNVYAVLEDCPTKIDPALFKQALDAASSEIRDRATAPLPLTGEVAKGMDPWEISGDRIILDTLGPASSALADLITHCPQPKKTIRYRQAALKRLKSVAAQLGFAVEQYWAILYLQKAA
ncbi:hypothetical protein FWF48_00945 [Candidatus Saccharibacteria bacterium]|nr:hypothetical protein [Candidatus Saccharibacteria bacterium]